MRPVDWGHLAIILEWAAFILVTPGLLGERGLKYISTILRRAAVVFYCVPDLLTLGPSRQFQLPESETIAKIKNFWGTILKTPRKTTRPIPALMLMLNLLLPAVLVVVGFALLRWPYRAIPASVLILGLVSLAFMFRKGPFFLPIRLHWITLYLLFFLIVFFSAIFAFSLVLWFAIPSLLVARGLIGLSEAPRLRTYLFITGVFMFTLSKAIEFFFVSASMHFHFSWA